MLCCVDGSGSGRSPWQPEGYLLKRGYFFANERWNAYRLRYFKVFYHNCHTINHAINSV